MCVFACVCVETGGMDGLISQIPGLSPTTRTPTEDRAQGRRSRVHESDSDYIKLAKQGGHKGRASTFKSLHQQAQRTDHRQMYFLPTLSPLSPFGILQDFCGTRTRFLLKLLHTNPRTGSILRQNLRAHQGNQ